MIQSNVDNLKRLKRMYPGPMNEKQIAFLRDLQAFIDVSIENGLSFRGTIGPIFHDVNGILAPDNYFERGIFVPKIAGYLEKKTALASELAAMEHDPSMSPDHVEHD